MADYGFPSFNSIKHNLQGELYLFVQSFAYDDAEKISIDYVVDELKKTIPIISFTQNDDLYDSIVKRLEWSYEKNNPYIFDLRFSGWMISRHVINVIGLGILIIPFRLIATALKPYVEFENPHFLNEDRFDICKTCTEHPEWLYESKSKKLPEEELEISREFIFRNHVQNPEYLYPSLYQDPLL